MEIPLELVEAKEAAEWELLALPGVRGVGIGFREEDGELIEELAVRIYVENTDELGFDPPSDIAGVGISVVEALIEPCAFPDDATYPELRGGIKISLPLRGFGTLGALVKDPQSGQLLGLTCYHVAGDPGETFPDTVWQPKEPNLVAPIPHDDNIGECTRVDFPSTPSPLSLFGRTSFVGLTDAAVIDLGEARKQHRTFSAAIAGLDSQSLLIDRVTGTADPELGLRAYKRGFRTGFTRGQIIARHLTVPWGLHANEESWVRDQFEISADPGGPFADTGDSGSLVLFEDDPTTAIGLLWAGVSLTRGGVVTQAGIRGVASTIANVESALGIVTAWA